LNEKKTFSTPWRSIPSEKLMTRGVDGTSQPMVCGAPVKNQMFSLHYKKKV